MSAGPFGGGRAGALLAALALVSLALAALLVWLVHVAPALDPGAGGLAERVAPDFVAFHAAARMAAEGEAALAYDWTAHRAAEQASFGGGFAGMLPWHYPPTTLLAFAPLAALPLWPAMALWCALTLALYLRVVWAILPDWRALAGALGAAPTVLVLVNGQTGFLIAALMGAALLAAERRPVLAGLLVGLVSLKPQLGLALPVALAAGGRWRVFAAATATVGAMVLVSAVALGVDTWRAFLGSIGPSAAAFRAADHWEMLATLYGYGRNFGLPHGAALALQGAVSLAALAAVALAWRRPALAFDVKAALLCFACAAAAPRALNYDLHVLVIGVLFQMRHALAAGFFRGEQLLVAAVALAGFVSVLAPPGAYALLAPALLLGCWLGRARG